MELFIAVFLLIIFTLLYPIGTPHNTLLGEIAYFIYAKLLCRNKKEGQLETTKIKLE
jgi:hypothetical protein